METQCYIDFDAVARFLLFLIFFKFNNLQVLCLAGWLLFHKQYIELLQNFAECSIIFIAFLWILPLPSPKPLLGQGYHTHEHTPQHSTLNLET